MARRQNKGRKKRPDDITVKYIDADAEKVVAANIRKFFRFLPLTNVKVLIQNMQKCGMAVKQTEREMSLIPNPADVCSDPTLKLEGAPKLDERRIRIMLPALVDSANARPRRANEQTPHFPLGPDLAQVNINLKHVLSDSAINFLCEVFMSYSARKTPLHFYGLDSDKFVLMCTESHICSDGHISESQIREVFDDTISSVQFYLELHDWLWKYSVDNAPGPLKGLTRYAVPGKLLGFPDWIGALCKVSCLLLYGHNKTNVAEIPEPHLLERIISNFLGKFATRRRVDKLGVILCCPSVSIELLTRQWTLWQIFLHYSGAQISDGKMDIHELKQFCEDFSILPRIATATLENVFKEVLGVTDAHDEDMIFSQFIEFLGRVGVLMFPPNESHILHALVGRYRSEFDAPILGVASTVSPHLQNIDNTTKHSNNGPEFDSPITQEVSSETDAEQARTANEIMAFRHPWSAISGVSRERMKRQKLVPAYVRAQCKYAIPDLNQRLPRAATPMRGGMPACHLARVRDQARGEEWVRVDDHVNTKQAKRRKFKLAGLQRTHGVGQRCAEETEQVMGQSRSAPTLGKTRAHMAVDAQLGMVDSDEGVNNSCEYLVRKGAALVKENGLTVEKMMQMHLDALARHRRRGSTGGIPNVPAAESVSYKNICGEHTRNRQQDDDTLKWQFFSDGNRHVMADAETLLRQLETIPTPETPTYRMLDDLESEGQDALAENDNFWITVTHDNGKTQKVKVARPLVSRASMCSRASNETATPTAVNGSGGGGGGSGSSDDGRAVVAATQGREKAVRSRYRGPLASELKCGL